MAKRLSAPGKTFFLGEYLALVGGPSILVTTRPRFELKVEAARALSKNFAPESPAGRFMSRHARDFSDWSLRFTDPHLGAGGLGASSAQWAMLYALKYGVHQNWSSLLDEYRQDAWDGRGSAPSGADVVAQFQGGITWFDGREFHARQMEWSFPSLSFTLIRTGVKLATHEHLKKPQAAPQDVLRDCVSAATRAFETRDEDLLALSIARYACALHESGRTASHSLNLLDQLRKETWVKAAKGCGAMGADVLLVLHDLAGAKKAAAWAERSSLKICGGLEDLDSGLRFET